MVNMIATGLSLKNFRNIKGAELYFCDGINIFCGNNAQGKTSILEALWIFCVGKSFRSISTNPLINFNKDSSKLNLFYYSSGRQQELEISFFLEKKYKLLKNGVVKKNFAENFGSFKTVLFVPEHLELIKAGPKMRREFLDLALCQIYPGYLKALVAMNKTLLQRSALLKDIRYNNSLLETLEVWDEKLAFYYSFIYPFRVKYIDDLKIQAAKAHLELSSNLENLDIFYNSTLKSETLYLKEKVFEASKRFLFETHEEDIKKGRTSIGPHRDDIEILLNGKSSRLFASQGQQRSAVLSLKAAEADILMAKSGEAPVLLLDDILSELDYKRQEYILNKAWGKQAFVTTCDIERIEGVVKEQKTAFKIFKVSDGEIFEDQGV